MEKKLHVVLDTNIWVGGIVFKQSISRRLLNCSEASPTPKAYGWEANEFFVLVSKEIVKTVNVEGVRIYDRNYWYCRRRNLEVPRQTRTTCYALNTQKKNLVVFYASYDGVRMVSERGKN